MTHALYSESSEARNGLKLNLLLTDNLDICPGFGWRDQERSKNESFLWVGLFWWIRWFIATVRMIRFIFRVQLTSDPGAVVNGWRLSINNNLNFLIPWKKEGHLGLEWHEYEEMIAINQPFNHGLTLCIKILKENAVL